MKIENKKHNPECDSELHKMHLCYIVSQGFNLSDPDEYKELVEKPRFKCQHCGRVANKAENLCKPTDM